MPAILNKKQYVKSLRKRVLVPIVISITLILAAIIIVIFSIEAYRDRATIKEIRRDLLSSYKRLEQDAASRQLISVRQVTLNRDIQDAWKKKDREMLFELSIPIFNYLRENHNITHFYYHDINKRNFLRIHNPNYHSDLIVRETLKISDERKAAFYGIEFGVHTHQFVLRTVAPWFINGELVGYVEMGEEIDLLINELSSIHGNDMLIVVDDAYLRSINGVEIEAIRNESIVSQNGFNVIHSIGETFETSIDISMKEILFDIVEKGYYKNSQKEFYTSTFQLTDVSNHAGANILFNLDLGELHKQKQFLILILIASISFFSLLIIIFLVKYTSQVQNVVESIFNELSGEVNRRKKSESELDSYSKNLEKIVETRTKELYQLQKMEVIGRLAGGIAHDFNNILAIMSNYLHLTKKNLSDIDKSSHYIEEITRAVSRAKILIKQMLAFSRQTHSSPENIRPQEVVREVASMLRSTFPSTIKIVEEVEESTKLIYSDSTQFHQIIMNLCTNAYQAMKNEQGVLTIGVRNLVLSMDTSIDNKKLIAGDYVELTIKDTGPGINEQILDHIFDPFFTTKEAGEGTGLGLSIVHSLVDMYSGYITVSNNSDGGATFRILFPAAETHVDNNLKHIDTDIKGEEHILLVDDEEGITTAFKLSLESLGYRVTAVNRGTSALEMVKKNPNEFDILITDQTMPDLTGSELSKVVLELNPDLPIILCTGYSSSIDEKSAREIGINEFVFKPLYPEEIATLIRKTLDHSALI